MDLTALLGATLVLLGGAFLQRLTGMGMALVSSPFLVLILGATTGVQTIQAMGTAVCLATAIIMWRQVNVRRALVLFLASCAGLLPGLWVATSLSPSWLGILIGSVTLTALGCTPLLRRRRALRGAPGVAIAGGFSGFMNVTAGVGGPPIVILAESSEWEYREYLATAQLFFAAQSGLALVARGVPEIPLAGWALMFASCALGIAVGGWVGSAISQRTARRLVLAVAVTGSLSIIVKGLLELRMSGS